MARTIQIVVSSEKTDPLISELRKMPGLIGLRVQRQSSIQPPGDVISLDATNRGLHAAIRLLVAHGIADGAVSSITTADPLGVVSASMGQQITRDTSDATWEEMELLIAKSSNMTANGILIMAIAGVVAAVGIANNALHIVIGAMVIAPGFEPISRISLGLVARGRAWRHGVTDTALGYGGLMAGAALAALVLQAVGQTPLEGKPSYLAPGVLVAYWTTISASSLVLAGFAGVAGALLIATNKEVLTAGVMIALALVPTAAITAMALVSGELALGAKSASRWLLEAGLVAAMSAAVFLWKRLWVQQRAMID